LATSKAAISSIALGSAAFSFLEISMTLSTEPLARKRGRPTGTLGPRSRQKQLADEFVEALGGIEKIAPRQERDIIKVAALISFAEESRRQITKYGAAEIGDLATLVRLEECAERAVAKLKLPTPTTINARTDVVA
jgi:hypothetical protein